MGVSRLWKFYKNVKKSLIVGISVALNVVRNCAYDFGG